jgi:hypothetical protein
MMEKFAEHEKLE